MPFPDRPSPSALVHKARMPALTPDSKSPDHVRLRDPLSEVTRRERRSLLGVSVLGVAITQGGLLPTEISNLGVKLGPSSQSALLVLIGLVCTYYLAAFLVYAASDYVAWKVALRDSIYDVWSQPRESSVELETEEDALRETRRQEALEEFMQKSNLTVLLAELLVLPVSRARAAFEFVLPAVVGLYAIVVLFLRSAA